MTCAACAARIEKKLNRLDGVTATVNYATEKASVTYPRASLEVTDLVHAIELIGYGAEVPAPRRPTAGITVIDNLSEIGETVLKSRKPLAA